MLRAKSQSKGTTESDASWAPIQAGLLQRTCACGQHTVAGGGCLECAKKNLLQRKTSTSGGTSAVPPLVNEVLRSPGQPLDADTRAFFEPRFNHDFSQVRVHSDVKASESAEAVNSLAYTVGQNIVFGAHQYAPSTGPGRHLLAHELTHTLQQSSTPSSMMSALRIGPSDDVHEQEAETQAARIVGSRGDIAAPLRTFASTPNLQRAPKDKTPVKPTVPAKAKCVEQRVALHEFSRGNDDLRECDYETARIFVSLWWNPCNCSDKAPNAPLRLNYHVVMGGKRFSEPKKLETEASEEVAGRAKDDKGKAKKVPIIGLRETGGKGKVQPLKHTKRPPSGDPGDFLDADFIPPQTVACANGSASGSVDVGVSQTITWSITTDAAQTAKAAITLKELTPKDRFPTPTRDLAKEKKYPDFPGTPRQPGCTCDAVNGACINPAGTDFCIPTAPPAQVGPGKESK